MSTSDEMNALFETEEQRIHRREIDQSTGQEVVAKDGSDIVKESNRLVCSCYTLTEVEQKLMFCFLRHIQKDDTIKRYTISVQEVQSVCGFSPSRFHIEIAQAADRLLSRVLTIYLDDKDAWIKTHWLSFIKYADGKITFEFEHILQEHLLFLQTKFTLFDVRNPMRLTGQYAGRLYLLFKQLEHLNKKLHMITVDDLKNYFELSPSMATVGKIRQRILDPSIKQINENTDIYIGERNKAEKYEPIKVGKAIVSFKFKISPNTKNIKKSIAQNDKKQDPQQNIFETENDISNNDEIYSLVAEYGVNRQIFNTVIAQFPNHEKEVIEYAVQHYKKKILKGETVNTPARYIIGIMQNYDSEAAQKEANYKPVSETLTENEKIAYSDIQNSQSVNTSNATENRTTDNEKLLAMSKPELLTHLKKLNRNGYRITRAMLKKFRPDIDLPENYYDFMNQEQGEP